LIKGRVLRSTGSWYNVLTENDEIIKSRLKGRFRIDGIRTTNPIAVGDNILTSEKEKDGTTVIKEILKRKNYIIRKSTKLSKAAHIIAANIDTAFLIVTVANPRISLGFIDRFLVSAEAHHVPCILVFNKIDLYDNKLREVHNNYIKIYEAAGYQCLSVSALEKNNLSELKKLMQDKTTLFSGHSGVGKSSIINGIESDLELRTDRLSDYSGKGKHTTTFAEMYELSFGGMIIDTPGIKEFGMYDFTPEEVSHAFREFRDFMHDCKFNNCTHVHEPGCAVKQAVAEGKINKTRYANFLTIINDEDVQLADWEK